MSKVMDEQSLKSGPAVSRRFVLVLGLLTGTAALSIDMSLPSIPDMVRECTSSKYSGLRAS